MERTLEDIRDFLADIKSAQEKQAAAPTWTKTIMAILLVATPLGITGFVAWGRLDNQVNNNREMLVSLNTHLSSTDTLVATLGNRVTSLEASSGKIADIQKTVEDLRIGTADVARMRQDIQQGSAERSAQFDRLGAQISELAKGLNENNRISSLLSERIENLQRTINGGVSVPSLRGTR